MRESCMIIELLLELKKKLIYKAVVIVKPVILYRCQNNLRLYRDTDAIIKAKWLSLMIW